MKNKKILLLLFLILIWLFFFVKGSKPQSSTSASEIPVNVRKRTQKEITILQLDYEKYQRRKKIKLNEEGHLFERFQGREEKEKNLQKIEVTEQELIMKELKAIIFLGIVSSYDHKNIYLEYRGDIYEVVDGNNINISTQNNKYNVIVSMDTEDTLTIYEPVEMLEVNINI